MRRPRWTARPGCGGSPRHLPAARQPLSGLHPALDDLHARRLHHGYFRHRRRAGELDACAGDARHPRRLRPRPATARRGGVMSALPLLIPLVIVLMRKLEGRGGAAVSAITVDTGRRSSTRPAERMRRAARRRRYLTNAGGRCHQRRPVGVDAHADLQHDHGRARSRRATCSAIIVWPPKSIARQLLDRFDRGLLVSRVFLAPVRQQRLYRRDGDVH